MVSELINRFLEHPRRCWIVWGGAVAWGLFVTLPCWDWYCEKSSQVSSLKTELFETTLVSENIGVMEQRLRQLNQSEGTEIHLFDQAEADLFRERITELTFDHGCQLKRLSLSDSRTTPWVAEHGLEKDRFDRTRDEDVDAMFDLETRLIHLAASGPLTKLTKLLVHLDTIEKFAVPTNLTIQREGENGQLALDIEISLYNLIPANDSRM
ncbi:hypothetical protein [Roseiconus lacunae]|uniref:hypothetical protein n=2 Tax=Roseiconus lacunae TaxID=2605694 RepID=UPI0011F1313E|nr:hypothetical protein [Roseiconus lacunae]